MKNILITGAFGFIGSNLAKEFLNKGKYSTYALDINEQNKLLYKRTYSWEKVEQIEWNKLNTVIHLAGKAHDTKNTSNAKSYYDINVGLTKIVFDKFLASETEKFIFFSSVKAAADTVEEDILTEEICPNPQTPYGRSKLQAERYILQHILPQGKKVYILRPCMIHGPGNKGNLNLLYNVVSRGIPYPLGLFNNKRSFTSIHNLIFIIEKLIDNPIESGVYQISDDEPCSTIDIIKLIAESLDRNPRIWNIPQELMQSIARSGDILHHPFNSERLKKLTETYLVSNSKLKMAIGVKTLPVTAHDGLLTTFKSFTC